jgi:hypothetical protein
MQALGVVWDDADPRISERDESATALAKPVHYGSRLMFDYWSDRAADGGLIVGRDVPSRALSPIMRNLAVYEPVDDLADFQIRLAGAIHLRRHNRDITGERLSKIFSGPSLERRLAILREVMRSALPAIHDIKVPQSARSPLHFEAIVLPVLAPDRHTRWLRSGMFFHD